MPIIRLRFTNVDGEIVGDLEVSDNVPVATLWPSILAELDLPADAVPRLVLDENDRAIDPTSTLAAAGVRDASLIRLDFGPFDADRAPVERARPSSPETGSWQGAMGRAPAAACGEPLLRQRPVSGLARTVAFWSGPAGGTGCTTMAISLAALAAERGIDAVLLALSEPAVSAYLHLPRVPGVADFFDSNQLARAEQSLTWRQEGGDEVGFRVVLGPTRSLSRSFDREQVAALIAAAQLEHALAILDLAPLVPGGSPWMLQPLLQATDVVLVAYPNVAGVSAVIEALATLRDVGTSAFGDDGMRLAINRRRSGGLSAKAFSTGVANIWGSCPPVAADVPPQVDLAQTLDRGELPPSETLTHLAGALGTALGLPGF